MGGSVWGRALGLLVVWAVLRGGSAAASVAQELEAPSAPEQSWLALEAGGAAATMRHRAVALASYGGDTLREVPDRTMTPRLSLGVHFGLGRLLGVRGLWETNTVDWYFARGVRAFALRAGAEQHLALGRNVSLGLGAFGAAADVSLNTLELTGMPSRRPASEGAAPFPERVSEQRAHQWLFGTGATLALHLHLEGSVYVRAQAGYVHYLQEASRFRAEDTVHTWPGFSVSLSGPSAGLLMGAGF
jgi:hypothetical protein